MRPDKNLSNHELKYDGPCRILEQLGDSPCFVKIEYNIEQIYARRMIEYNPRDENENKNIPLLYRIFEKN